MSEHPAAILARANTRLAELKLGCRVHASV
jgi:hypothetical protein